MNHQITKFTGHVADREGCAGRAGDLPLIADLAAGFAIERRLVHHNSAGLTGGQLVNNFAIGNQRHHLAFSRKCFIAKELTGTKPFAQVKPKRFGCGITGSRPGFSGRRFLLRHSRIKAVIIKAPALAAQNVLRQIQREAIGIIKPKRNRARQNFAVGKLVGFVG